jgi:hypothetical protein
VGEGGAARSRRTSNILLLYRRPITGREKGHGRSFDCVPLRCASLHFAKNDRLFSPDMDHDYFVYFLTDKSRATLYIGITNDLQTGSGSIAIPSGRPSANGITASCSCMWSISAT